MNAESENDRLIYTMRGQQWFVFYRPVPPRQEPQPIAVTTSSEAAIAAMKLLSGYCKRGLPWPPLETSVDHDWEQTGWEYDDSFFRCRICGLKTHCRRGYPSATPADCRASRILPCIATSCTSKRTTKRATEAIRVKRDELLKVLKENRTTHRDTFERATAGYRKRAIEELDASLRDAREGKKIRRAIGLTEPMDQTKDYDRAIRMLEMTVDEIVTIGAHEFQQYVMDDWAWKEQFTASNSAYLGAE